MPKNTIQQLAILLMAAGCSSRLGQPKQLIEITEKNQLPQSLLHRQIAMIDAICSTHNAEAYCVLGFQYEKLATHLVNFKPADNVRLVNNVNWSTGLSSSIAKGVSSLDNDVDAVLVFMVDQWRLTIEDLTRLITSWKQQPNKIHIASNGRQFSPPVIFPKDYFNELTLLSGNSGAKPVIKQHIKHVSLVDIHNAFTDLDTPKQLQELIKYNNELS